jgi:hypothetical protein
MNVLEINKIEFKKRYPTLEEISEKLDSLTPEQQVATLNWKEFQYKPEVSFKIAYTNKEILLKYYVREQYFKAEKTETNQSVYEDSCVEFFVSPADDGIYYNIEFNAIGTCLMGSGTSRADSTRVYPEVVSLIRRMGSAGISPVSEREGDYSWTLTVAIPLEVFFRHKITGLKGKTFRANFYKCGDKLTVPHFVTWNPVGTGKPDFHQPGFFGVIKFM